MASRPFPHPAVAHAEPSTQVPNSPAVHSYDFPTGDRITTTWYSPGYCTPCAASFLMEPAPAAMPSKMTPAQALASYQARPDRFEGGGVPTVHFGIYYGWQLGNGPDGKLTARTIVNVPAWLVLTPGAHVPIMGPIYPPRGGPAFDIATQFNVIFDGSAAG